MRLDDEAPEFGVEMEDYDKLDEFDFLHPEEEPILDEPATAAPVDISEHSLQERAYRLEIPFRPVNAEARRGLSDMSRFCQMTETQPLVCFFFQWWSSDLKRVATAHQLVTVSLI